MSLKQVSLQRISQDHSAMITILSGRRMRLQAAATLWRQCGGGALVSYLLKVNDESVTADILPILVNRHVTVFLGFNNLMQSIELN